MLIWMPKSTEHKTQVLSTFIIRKRERRVWI